MMLVIIQPQLRRGLGEGCGAMTGGGGKRGGGGGTNSGEPGIVSILGAN